ARTVAEALRLAVIELLQVQSGEVRATYRLYGTTGNTLEVVLYDAVPGGAGYCAHLGEAGFSFDGLLRRARNRLDCKAQCDSACRTCLCDYSNQRHWDSFDRLSALAWIDALLDPRPQHDGPGHYVRWAKPSLGGLNDRFTNYKTIHLVARSLVEQTSYSEESLNLLLQWLQEGKSIHIHLANKLEDKPKSQAALTLYRRLSPYVQEERLHLYRIPDGTDMVWDDLPRVFAGSEINLPVIRQHFAVQPLMEGLVAAPADTGVIDETLSADLSQFVSRSIPLPQDVLREGERMSLWELGAGEKRDFPAMFDVIAECRIKDLVIRDPYCGSGPNRGKLKSFIATLKSLVGEIQHTAIHCKESRDKDGNIEFYLDVERHVDDILVSLGLENRDVDVHPLKGSGRTFHDREIDITTVTGDGCDITYRYFLTGGIDYLMDERSATRVFCVQL
ncbi:MAG: DUF1998 domain-containing protein, partial [Sulfuritalea sp.]